MRAATEPVMAWARSGAMWLTGRPEGPALAIDAPVAARVEALGAAFERSSTAAGSPVELDWAALLGERAAIAGHTRSGTTSPGGSCHLLRAADGWIAVNLARPSDAELLPAWLGVEVDETDPRTSVAAVTESLPAAACVERGQLLGIPVALVPPYGSAFADDQAAARQQPFPPSPALIRRIAPPGPRRHRAAPVVVDFSSLWAGPLCAHLLGLAGARVIKVESISRPDGARSGPAAFYDLLHAGHESVALEFADRHDVEALLGLVTAADMVIEASRPRAFAALGLDPVAIVSAHPHITWVTITGYGRTGPWSNRTAFGDDAACAAGLVAVDEEGPVFCGDAIADPIGGIAAAVAALDGMLDGGGTLIDVALREAAGHAMAPIDGPTAMVTELEPDDVRPPRARPPAGTAPPLGADTDSVLREIGVRR
jgi:crotonobetainyl-CoA:carnitine CoA-transferase CaiB-like acyl-CoA transferase